MPLIGDTSLLGPITLVHCTYVVASMIGTRLVLSIGRAYVYHISNYIATLQLTQPQRGTGSKAAV